MPEITVTEANVKEAVGETWFDLEDLDDAVQLVTRNNGDVGDEQPGHVDLVEARRLCAMLRQVFGPEAEIEIEPVDEWVYVIIQK